MSDYLILSDNTTDLPESYCEEHHLSRLYLTCLLDGVEYNEKNPLDDKAFYAKIRSGSMPTTSQVNIEQAREFLERFVSQGKDVIYIAFSSGLSGTYASVKAAAEQVLPDWPERRITVIDSLAASLGEGLLVHKALTMAENGASYDEVVTWVTEHRLNLVHNFTVDDLHHLHRGGRVSKASAILGSLVNIKPMLHVDNDGHLILIGKVRGRKKSLIGLVDAMEQQIGSWRDKNDVIFISHSDCLEDAQFVADLIKSRFGYESFLINYVGPVIGSHTGCGTVALFYMGDVR